ncbi:MAG: hypothetical protein ACTSPL_07845 [Candidatus Odinarchaeia archaeon]
MRGKNALGLAAIFISVFLVASSFTALSANAAGLSTSTLQYLTVGGTVSGTIDYNNPDQSIVFNVSSSGLYVLNITIKNNGDNAYIYYYVDEVGSRYNPYLG